MYSKANSKRVDMRAVVDQKKETHLLGKSTHKYYSSVNYNAKECNCSFFVTDKQVLLEI